MRVCFGSHCVGPEVLERSRMSLDITEACPRFCLLKMVCVFLKDFLKRGGTDGEGDKWI